jgi:DNA-binding response OmpR family regulator
MAGRILIIEDELNLADVLKIILSKEGYIVQCVSDGNDGARLMSKNEFDIVICDLRLLSGFITLKNIKKYIKNEKMTSEFAREQ